jgi:zinc/manganese transport system permease protein
MSDALALLLLPFAASVAFVLIHAYFGVHVLRRNIVFADLALAQLSALGATVAYANGHAPASAAGFGYALLFTAVGAALLTLGRSLPRTISQEAFIGILYVLATAVTILVVDRAPQGAEHVKKILVGSILTVGPGEVLRVVVLYATIGLLHWLLRRPLLAAMDAPDPIARGGLAPAAWDFAFFFSFGVVVTSSVAIAGVLLVFSFLIIPAVIGTMYSSRFSRVLAVAWGTGILASAAGLAGSYALDLPTGAAMVAAYAAVLLLAGAAKILVFGQGARRGRNLRLAARAVSGLILLLILASSVWLMVNPTADQPLARAVESTTGYGPSSFLGRGERDIYESALRDSLRFQREVDRLNASERSARYEATPLSDEEIRRIASYQMSFNEMVRGEQFVLDVLRGKARARERWLVGLPLALIALAGIALLVRRRRASTPRD